MWHASIKNIYSVICHRHFKSFTMADAILVTIINRSSIARFLVFVRRNYHHNKRRSLSIYRCCGILNKINLSSIRARCLKTLTYTLLDLKQCLERCRSPSDVQFVFRSTCFRRSCVLKTAISTVEAVQRRLKYLAKHLTRQTAVERELLCHVCRVEPSMGQVIYLCLSPFVLLKYLAHIE